MAETLTFAQLHRYDTRKQGIILPVSLSVGEKVADLHAKLDTGSSLCVFDRLYGEELGLDIESGKYQEIGSPTGDFVAYGHWVTLSALGMEHETTVYFSKHHNLGRNVLGRQGWLDRVRLGLIDYDGKLYLSEYNDPAA